MIEPTIGRKVWYVPLEAEKQRFATDSDPGSMYGMEMGNSAHLGATVIAVWGDRCVSVRVTDAKGKQFTCSSRALLQDDDAPPAAGGYAMWLLYQKGQAAKA